MPEKAEIVRTLVGGGFTHAGTREEPNCLVMHVWRTDLLGVPVHYLIAFSSRMIPAPDVASLAKLARREGHALVLVGDAAPSPSGVSRLTYPQFFDRFGGSILSLLPLEPDYPERLRILGANRLPNGLDGNPDTLFEEYVHAGLQFLFGCRVVSYGQERRFESVTDGLVIGHAAPVLLYDAKAAGGGYEMSAESVRQFSDYADSFHRRWEHVVGRLTAFLVISGSFADSADSLRRRSREVRAKCGVPLSFLDADTFGRMVGLFVDQPVFRRVVDWAFVFSNEIVAVRDVENDLKARQRDAVVLP